MKLDAFTIFLILLGLLVVITIFTNLKAFSKKETFVNFQNNQPPGRKIYIPQYSLDKTQTVYSLYDNLYFDTRNATLIEVNSPSCSESPQTGANCEDLTGASITAITTVPRNGLKISTHTAANSQTNDIVLPISTEHSLIKTVEPFYSQFTYTTSCDTTDTYQVIYISWHTNTFLHLIKLSGKTDVEGTNLSTFNFDDTRLVDTVSYTNSKLHPFIKAPTLEHASNNTSSTDPNYLSGKAKLYQLTGQTSNNTPIKLSYDITNGNIVVKIGESTYKVYSREGKGAAIAEPKDNAPFNELTYTIAFTIADLPDVTVLVIAYKYNTIINVITTDEAGSKYKLAHTYRFNKTGLVNNSSNDTDNLPTSAPTSSPAPSTASPTPLNSVTNLNGSTSDNSSVCGDDLSCKWYWYFNTIAQKTNGVNYLSDDYFLKTEAIPPVCPQCPQCSSGGGACNHCGGNGGAGSTTSPATLKPSTNKTMPPGAVTDSSGNTYIPYADPSGNTKYVLYAKYQNDGGQGNSGGGEGNNDFKGIPPPPRNMTSVDKDGQFMTSANPNTLGGGLAVTSLGLNQLGTAGLNNAGSFANNIVDTAGNAVNSATNLVGGVANSATNLVGGVANSATNLVGGVASGLTNLVGGTIGTAADLAKGAGSGIMNMGNRGAQGVQGVQGVQGAQGLQGVAGSSTGYSSLGSTPASSFGNMPGQTPVDNYSYYGATQTKGSNYMPVTADFSAFSK